MIGAVGHPAAVELTIGVEAPMSGLPEVLRTIRSPGAGTRSHRFQAGPGTLTPQRSRLLPVPDYLAAIARGSGIIRRIIRALEELGPRDPIIRIDVLLGHGPALLRRVGAGALDLPGDGLRLVGDGLVGALPCVDRRDHRFLPRWYMPSPRLAIASLLLVTSAPGINPVRSSEIDWNFDYAFVVFSTRVGRLCQ